MEKICQADETSLIIHFDVTTRVVVEAGTSETETWVAETKTETEAN